jgi:C-terminal processing protease CtpA/Prc
VITKINGQQLTLSNYQSLLSLLSQNHTITYNRPVEGGPAQDKGTLSLTVVEYAENPNYFHNIYTVGSRKVGYYIYNFFADGPVENSMQYTDEMDQIFADFKNEGVTDLVLDLRFNSGGAETSSVNLASLIGNGVDNTKVFSKKQFNAELNDYILNEPSLGEGYLVSKFKNKTQNIGGQLSGKVYVLTKNRTASASELVINGLKPFMEVFIIGDTTVGKNVGSFSLYEENDPKIKWGMQPIVVQFSNSVNQSDYSEGFFPDIPNRDNNLLLLPLGDPNENLLSIALGEIAGTGGRKAVAASQKKWGAMLGTSLDRKRRHFNLQLDSEPLRKAMKAELH